LGRVGLSRVRIRRFWFGCAYRVGYFFFADRRECVPRDRQPPVAAAPEHHSVHRGACANEEHICLLFPFVLLGSSVALGVKKKDFALFVLLCGSKEVPMKQKFWRRVHLLPDLLCLLAICFEIAFKQSSWPPMLLPFRICGSVFRCRIVGF
jgi:hypothetical protein